MPRIHATIERLGLVVEELLNRAGERGYLTASAVRRIDIEHARSSEWFGPYDGEITNTDLRAMLARHAAPMEAA